MFERYTEKARRVIFFARYEASQFGSPYIETEHLLLGLIREDKRLTKRFLHSQVESIRKEVEDNTTVREKTPTSEDLPLSNESKRVLSYAAEEAERLSHKHIGTEHLFLGLLREEKSFAAQVLAERGVRLSVVREELAGEPHEGALPQKRPDGLDEFGSYVSDPADRSQPLIGREKELDRLIELLCRMDRKNPVLVGEPGAGKKTIAGELARRMAEGDVPPSLAGKSVIGLQLPQLRARASDAVWGEKVDRSLVTAAEAGAIFFVNRMHDRTGVVSPVALFHITDLLQRPIMAGEIQCIGTATPANFARLRAEEHWLAQYFEPVEAAPADEESAIRVLLGIKAKYETFHNVSYGDEIIAHAVSRAGKYVRRGCLPGTAVDVIDEAGAAAQLRQGSLPAEVIEVQKRIRSIAERMEASIANHEFEKARFYSDEERKERDNLGRLRKEHKLDDHPALNITREDIEIAVSKVAELPIEEIRPPGDEEHGS